MDVTPNGGRNRDRVNAGLKIRIHALEPATANIPLHTTGKYGCLAGGMAGICPGRR